MSAIRLTMTTLAVLSLAITSALADELRIALVIGNSAYTNARLANPVNDAQLISRALRQHGFEVIQKLDAGEREMGRAVKAFGERLETVGSDAVGLFYYAGHGVQVGGINYLIPVDADIEDEEDVPIEAVSADHILGIIEASGNQLNLMFLDACRDNPFLRTSRNARHGLAMMNAPAGVFIGYATGPGGVAEDGDGTNSPFTIAMATTMGQPGEPIESMFKRVRLNVIAATEGEQTPWSASSLTGDFSFAPGAGVVAPLPPIEPADHPTRDMVRQAQEMLAAMGYDPGPIDGDMGRRTTAAVTAFQQSKGIPVDGLVSDVLMQHLLGAEEAAPAVEPALAVWDRIAGSDRAADFESFLALFPSSPKAAFARERLAELRRSEEIAPQPAPELGALPPAQPQPAADIYSQSIQRLAVGHYAAAQDGFQAVIDAYPDDPLAGNAHFWIGEILMKQGDHQNAAIAYERVYNAFPDSNKGADSLLKLGMAFAAMGRNREACATYERLTREFVFLPDHIADGLPAKRAVSYCH
jgi:tol-pal system protein YbgF